MLAMENISKQQEAFSQKLEAKLDLVAEDTQFIRGVMDEQHRGGKQR